MKFDAGEIRDPNKRRQIVRQNVIYVALVAFAPDRRSLYPVRTMFSRVLFEEVFFVHAFGIALQSEWTSRKMRQQDRRDAGVVIDHLSLGEPGCGVKNLVQVSQTQMFAVDLNDFRLAQAASQVSRCIISDAGL